MNIYLLYKTYADGDQNHSDHPSNPAQEGGTRPHWVRYSIPDLRNRFSRQGMKDPPERSEGGTAPSKAAGPK
jgi:hypothetical protein